MLLLNQTSVESAPKAKGRRSSAEAVPSERRRGLRIDQSRPIKVFEPTSSRYFAGQTCDVSSTGLRIELPASMPVREGHTVSVHVGMSDKGQPLANRRAMIPAKIVWLVRTGDLKSPKLMAGVEFVASIAAHLDAA
ncbi:MAG: PilZ domain-containing protein [Phycisphaerae bacterium]|nr:PilZ domain-containing protein [Tepidisphaeraceae bacterium]